MNASTTTAAIAMIRRRLDLGIALTATYPSERSAHPITEPAADPASPVAGAAVLHEVAQGLPERARRHEREVAGRLPGVGEVVHGDEEDARSRGFRGGDLVLDPPDRADLPV